MPLVRMKLKELQDGEVRYISLVDRAATRMPIRVIKRGEEMLDLTSIKRMVTTKKETTYDPQVSGVIVYAQKSEAIGNKVRDAVKAAGFKVDTIVKNSDGKTIMYQQADDPLKDAQLVRLSDDVVVAVKGFQPANPNIDGNSFEDAAASKNFHQGVDSSLDVLFEKICNTLNVAKSEQEAAQTVGSLLDGFKKYVVGMVESLPATAFKVDIAVRKAVDDPAAFKGDILSLASIEELFSKQSPDSMGENEWGAMTTGDKLTWILGSWVKKGEPAKVAMACPDDMDKDKWGAMSDDDKKKHLAGKGERTVKAEGEPKRVKASEVMAAITALSTKVDGMITKQAETDATLATVKQASEEAVKKNDDLAKKMAGVVVAGAGPEDKPGKGGAKVEKVDLRTGNFDTAFLSRNERIARRTAQ